MADLVGVRLKLEWAEKHLKIATRMVRWFARHKCTIERKHNPETNEVECFARLGEPDPVISLLFGDAIHSMRAALDHLVYQLVLSNPDRPDGVPNDKTMFPVCDTREGFRSQVNVRARIKGVPDGACAVIDRLQPYHRREAGLDYQTHPLWVLNQLENIDKHRRLAVTAGMPIGHHATIHHPNGTVTEHLARREVSAIVGDGTKLWSFQPPRPGEGEMEVKGTLFSTVTFSEPDAGLVNVDAASILWQILDFLTNRVTPELGSFVE